MEPYFFDDQPVIGALAADRAIIKLLEIYDGELPEESFDAESLREPLSFLRRKPRPFDYARHEFGYIPPRGNAGDAALPVSSALLVKPDESLKDGRVVVRLDYMGVAEYPGRGNHEVLFDFYGENHLPEGEVEAVHFTQTFRVNEGGSIGVVGYPIFVGLNVGQTGIAFRCRTVNVKNEGDEALLRFLDSTEFQGGLKLATTAQPALKPLSSLAIGLTKAVAGRHKNVPVQSFYLGLDFMDIATTAKLAVGSYVAVQLPDSERWDWAEWLFDANRGRIVNTQDRNVVVPFNYIVFSVSPFDARA